MSEHIHELELDNGFRCKCGWKVGDETPPPSKADHPTGQNALLSELDALYKRYREIEQVAVWGGSYEREEGARMGLRPLVNKMFDTLLTLMEARKATAKKQLLQTSIPSHEDLTP